jgi:hypothetical protein
MPPPSTAASCIPDTSRGATSNHNPSRVTEDSRPCHGSGFPLRRPGFRGRVRSCGICGGKSGIGAGFLRVLRFPLPIRIPPIAPQSLSSSIRSCAIGQAVAAVPSALKSHPMRKIPLLSIPHLRQTSTPNNTYGTTCNSICNLVVLSETESTLLRRQLTDLFYQHLVEWKLAGEAEVIGENLPPPGATSSTTNPT